MSSQSEGHFELKTPEDLLEKLRHDRERLQDGVCILRDDPREAHYAAYDFFVAAYHMAEWVWPAPAGERYSDERNQIIQDQVLLGIAGDLANGSKHFRLEDGPDHVSDKETYTEGDYSVEDYAAADWDTDGLRMKLDGEAADAYGARTTATELADELIEFWEDTISKLERLRDLRAEGTLTEEEFQAQKEKVLDSN